jgi:hypothetical protein
MVEAAAMSPIVEAEAPSPLAKSESTGALDMVEEKIAKNPIPQSNRNGGSSKFRDTPIAYSSIGNCRINLTKRRKHCLLK